MHFALRSTQWLIFRRVGKIAESVVSSRLSVRIEQLGSHSTDFHKILYLRSIRKSDEEIQVALKFDKNKWYFTQRPMYIFDHISLGSS